MEKISRVLLTYKVGDILYTGVIIRRTGLAMKDAYLLLDEIEALHIIEKAFEVHCPECQKYTGAIYHSLNDLPDDFFCDECENEFVFPEGLLVVYRVIQE